LHRDLNSQREGNTILESIDTKKIKYLKTKVIGQSERLWESFLWRYTNNMYHALTVEIMLQRTRAEQVEPIYRNFTEHYSSPGEYLEKCSHNIFTHLGLLGRNLQFQKLSQILVLRKEIPIEKNELLKLPGVGLYVASAFRSLHLRKRDTLVDSNIIRFYGRFFGLDYKKVSHRDRGIQELSERITPKYIFRTFNYAVLDFTRKICKPINPECGNCFLNKKCNFYHQLK